MKIKNIEVCDYVEMVDGSVNGCELMERVGDGYGVYGNENGKFLIKDFEGESEFVWKVV